LLDLLDTLKNQKVTVMVATHDLDQAARHFDRILLLNHRLIAFGNPTDVLRTENLLSAYGGRLRSSNGDNILSADDCCDEGEHGHTH
jgi:ABC-type Mn2+/Zn2+ transport system ATPase subunit